MCGIAGYLGPQDPRDFIMAAGMRLRYRGYDSAGANLYSDAIGPHIRKVMGGPENLDEPLRSLVPEGTKLYGGVAFVHTRWATHGEPNVYNAHPHTSTNTRIRLIHNGMLIGDDELRAELVADGYVPRGPVDSELIAHLIDRAFMRGAATLEGAVSAALECLAEGSTYALAVWSEDYPDVVVLAQLGMSLVIGIGKGEVFFASDEIAMAGYVEHVIHMLDGEITTLYRAKPFTIGGYIATSRHARAQKISVTEEDIGKGRFPTFTDKEIHEQPRVLIDALRGRVSDEGLITFTPRDPRMDDTLRMAKRVIIVGCGTSLYAGGAVKKIFESLARTPVEVLDATDMSDDPLLFEGDLVIAVSQSGETKTTCDAVMRYRQLGAKVIAVTNRVGSKLTRNADWVLYIRVGFEIAVASTKSFTGQVMVLAMLALWMATLKGTTDLARLKKLAQSLRSLPAKIATVIEGCGAALDKIVDRYHDAPRFMVIGRGYGLPLCHEAALKITEVGRIDAHAYSSSGLQHGPLTLVEDGVPVIVLALGNRDALPTMRNDMNIVRSRGGHVIAIVGDDDLATSSFAHYSVSVPEVADEWAALIAAPIVQLLAVKLGVKRGVPVDDPPNLAKCVVV